MYRTLTKTLYEKRWTILIATIGFALLNFALIQIFPAMRDAFSQLTTNLPPGLEGWFGADGNIWQTVKGFVSLEITGQMGLLLAVFAMVFALGLTPTDEQNGTLLTTLSKPITRTKIFIAKLLALIIMLAIIMVGFALGTWLGTLPIDPIPLTDLLRPTLAVFLLATAIASLAYSIALIFRSKALAGVSVGVYIGIGYFITALKGDVDLLRILAALTPFDYYNTPNTMYEPFTARSLIFLLAMILIPPILATLIFRRRDLKTH